MSPCPWCGKTDMMDLVVEADEYDGPVMVCLECTRCLCRGPLALVLGDETELAVASEAWDKRVNVDLVEAQATVKALQKEIGEFREDVREADNYRESGQFEDIASKLVDKWWEAK